MKIRKKERREEKVFREEREKDEGVKDIVSNGRETERRMYNCKRKKTRLDGNKKG